MYSTTMDEETSRSARALLPCLLPLHPLKKICDQSLFAVEPVDTFRAEKELFPWKEYRLHGQPQSLKAFRDLFLLESGEYDDSRAIWIPESDAFVCIQQYQVAYRHPRAYREGVFQVSLFSDKRRGGGSLSVIQTAYPKGSETS
jgi:hypothetical protein